MANFLEIFIEKSKRKLLRHMFLVKIYTNHIYRIYFDLKF